MRFKKGDYVRTGPDSSHGVCFGWVSRVAGSDIYIDLDKENSYSTAERDWSWGDEKYHAWLARDWEPVARPSNKNKKSSIAYLKAITGDF